MIRTNSIYPPESIHAGRQRTLVRSSNKGLSPCAAPETAPESNVHCELGNSSVAYRRHRGFSGLLSLVDIRSVHAPPSFSVGARPPPRGSASTSTSVIGIDNPARHGDAMEVLGRPVRLGFPHFRDLGEEGLVLAGRGRQRLVFFLRAGDEGVEHRTVGDVGDAARIRIGGEGEKAEPIEKSQNSGIILARPGREQRLNHRTVGCSSCPRSPGALLPLAGLVPLAPEYASTEYSAVCHR